MFSSTKGIFFLVVCVLVVLALAIVKSRRRFLLMLLMLFFPFSAGLIFYNYHGIMLTDFPLLVLFIILLTEKKKFRFAKEGYFILLLVLWGLITSVNASHQGNAISESLRFLRGILVFWVVTNAVRSPKDLQVTLNAILGGLLFQGLIAAYQWRIGPVGLGFLGEAFYAGCWRTRGTFSHESYFGNYLIMLVPIVFRLFVFYRPASIKLAKAHLRKYGVILILGVLALFTSMTRGPWVSFVLSIGIMIGYSLFKKKLRPRVMAPLIIAMLGAIVFLLRYLPNILSQFGEDRMQTASIRMPLNKVAVEVIKSNPVFGVGMGNYTLICGQYVKPEQFTAIPEYHLKQLYWDCVHNSFLLVVAESGIVGGFLFLGFFIMIMIKIKRLLTIIVNPFLMNLTIGVATGLLGIFIAFQVSPDIRIHQINVLFFLMASLILVIEKLHNIQNQQIKFKTMKINREIKYHENFGHIR